MKKFVLGFLTAALLFTALPIGSAVQQYILQPTAAKIVVDGAEIKDAKLPIMAYEGYNYIPAAVFRSICDKIGVGFAWDNAKKEIQLTTKVTSEAAISTQPKATDSTAPAGLSDPTKISIHTFDGSNFVWVGDVGALLEEREYEMVNTQKGLTVQIVKNNSVVLGDISFIGYGGKVYFKYDYYIDNILPLLQ